MALAEARRRLMARPSPEHLAFVLTFSVFLAFLAGMLAAWVWALGRLWRGIPLLDGVRPLRHREARWGAVSVLALIVLYLMVNAPSSGAMPRPRDGTCRTR